MKVNIIVDAKHGKDDLTIGESIVSKEGTEYNEATLKYFCDMGWAEDDAGVYPTSHPGLNETVLFVFDATSSPSIPSLEV